MRKIGKVKKFSVVSLLLVMLTACRSTVGRHRINSRYDKIHRKEENVGSVLFDRHTTGKICWENEQLILLNSRRTFQDLLPQVDVIDYRNDSYIGILMDYIDICLETVRRLTGGKMKHLVLKALADTLAGYLRVAILPATKDSYYAGNIKYRKAKRLYDLYDELKVFLRSNGVGWKKARELHQHLDISPITIPEGKSDQDCAGLILYPGPDQSLEVPMPFFDNDANPSSIALPFEVGSLSSLFSENSTFILVEYYAAGQKCLSSRSTKNQLEKFQRQLYDWIQQHVNVHLNDEKWYPAFGGVLKVTASLEAAGLRPRKNSGHHTVEKTFGRKSVAGFLSPFPPMNKQEEALGRNELVIIAVTSALLIWLLLGMSLICWKILATHSSKSTKETPVAVLYENRKYPSPDISSPSEGGILKRFKRRWRRKLSSTTTPRCDCPSDDEDEQDCDEERCLGSMSYSTDETDRRARRKKIQKNRTKFTSTSSNNVEEQHRSFPKSRYTTDESSSSDTKNGAP